MIATAVAIVVLGSGCTAVLRDSVASDGTPADAGSQPLGARSISDDGRYVVFTSDAANLVAHDTNGVADVYRHDNRTGATVRVSVGPSGAQAAAASSVPTISGDGDHVVFRTQAALEPGDTNGRDDVYVRSVRERTTERVSIRPHGAPLLDAGPAASIESATVSDDGRLVLMNRSDGQDFGDLYLRDRVLGTTAIVAHDVRTAVLAGDGRHVLTSTLCDRPPCPATSSVVPIGGGTPAVIDTECGFGPADISADGRFVVGTRFGVAPTLTCPGPTGLVRWDATTGRFRAVPIAVGPSVSPIASVARSGRFVAAIDAGGTVRVADLATGVVQAGDADALGRVAAEPATGAALSGNGRYVAFTSPAALVAGDAGSQVDVFTRFMMQPGVTHLDPAAVPRGGHVSVVVTGTELLPGASIGFSGTGITVDGFTVTGPTRATVELSVEAGAAPGPRDVVVHNRSGFGQSAGWCAGCFAVT